MGALPNTTHERFCEKVYEFTFEGLKRGAARTKAYREVIYQGGDATDAELAPNARRYANQPHIKARLLEITDYHSKLKAMDGVWDREILILKVQDMIEDDGKDRVPASTLLARLQGWESPTKIAKTNAAGDDLPELDEDVLAQAIVDALTHGKSGSQAAAGGAEGSAVAMRPQATGMAPR